jgi:hypothetical protein
MSDAHLNLDVKLSEKPWELIRDKASLAWKAEYLGSKRREAVSKLHGNPVVLKTPQVKL